jgi:hypothetical protein
MAPPVMVDSFLGHFSLACDWQWDCFAGLACADVNIQIK